jgi:sterol desaturase/sphingolipid hydroxylase (fatty acid hydroxylase superfamily)
VIVSALLGVLTWTLLEYVIHRWGGHDRRYRKTPFGVEHIRHHAEGNYFAPTWKKLAIAAVVTGVLVVPAIALVGTARGVSYVVGLMAFYGVYEVLHRREHTHAGFGPYARWARRHHFHHHFVDGRTNHGVTSPLWDLVFGTYRTPGIIKVPPRLAMKWLEDPAALAAFRGTFVLAQAQAQAQARETEKT